MTLRRLRLRNLVFHWRANSAVFLGVVVGTAVLTGALLVGDSLRGSLRDLTLRRLGWIDQVLVTPHFFRAKLADDILESDPPAKHLAPALLLQATLVPPGQKEWQQARGVTVFGVDQRFWDGWEHKVSQWNPEEPGLWLSSNVANDLEVSVGDRVSLRLQKPSAIPSETLLGKKDADQLITSVQLPVQRILSDEDPESHFTLRPSLETPRVAYVPLKFLQQELELEGRANALLAGGVTGPLQTKLQEHLQLADWGLVLRGPETWTRTLFELDRNNNGVLQRSEWRRKVAQAVVREMDPQEGDLPREKVLSYFRQQHPYLSLESRQLLLPSHVSEAAQQAAQATKLRAAPTLVYLADSIEAGGTALPYSVIAALDPTLKPPLGPFLPQGKNDLGDAEIVLVQEEGAEGSERNWKGWPKSLKAGEEVIVRYLPPEEQHGEQKVRQKRFQFAGFVPLTGVRADPNLTPEFPGITDKVNIGDWEKPFPTFKRERITRDDEKYWEHYRTAPKAYVSLATGQQLWTSRFGNLTSVRLASRSGAGDLQKARQEYTRELLTLLAPEKGGLVFEHSRENALKSSQGGMNFSYLFLAFSFFLIAAALLLVGLLFRLNLERRAEEIGLLFAEGYNRGVVRSLLLGEGIVLAAVGAVVGTGVAIAYSYFLVELLAGLWPDKQLQSFLSPHFTVLSLVIGAVSSLLVSVLTVAWVVFSMSRVAPRSLLTGETTGEREPGLPTRSRWGWWVCGLSVVGGVVLLCFAPYMQNHEAQAGTFFGSGFLFLTACLSAVWAWMSLPPGASTFTQGWWGVGLLGIRNASRHRSRSLLTAGLLASAAFLVVAVESFRRHADAGQTGLDAPNGGFTLLAESDLPLVRSLASKEGREEILLNLELQYQDEGKAPEKQKKALAEARKLLNDPQFKVFAFRLRKGDDASCLNLFQPTRPRILGVPDALIERGGFRFAAVEESKGDDPWKVLQKEKGEGIPAFGEKNTVQWVLLKGLGSKVQVQDEQGDEATLRIAGLLQDSVFQSSLLISEGNFLELYPEHEGFNYFLIQSPEGKEDKVKELLERGLADRGFAVTESAKKLEGYLAVENTYLSTFQALGGLGLILGSLGLAVVLLRGVWERRAELALLRALGYSRVVLGWLVLSENGFLLVLGLLAGTVSALVSVAPHLVGQGAPVPWLRLGQLLVVLVVGLVAGLLAVISTLRAPLIPALRRE